MSFKSQITASLGWNWISGAIDEDRLEYMKKLLEGHGYNQAEVVWHRESLTLADGAEHLWALDELARTVLGDILTLELTEVKAILITNLSPGGGTLIVGNAPYDCWWEPFGAIDDTVEVPRDSALLLTNRRDGWWVLSEQASSSSSGESGAERILRVAASGGPVTYSIAIIGTVAGSSSGV